MRTILLTLTATLLGTSLAFAAPEVRVESLDGVPRIVLTGNFAHSRYVVFRSPGLAGPYAPLTALDVLCVGPCVIEDPAARMGSTYWYRFDFQQADGSRASFGPYAVTIPSSLGRAVGARVLPNPVRGPAQIEIHLAASSSAEPVRGEVRVFDVQGRLVREIRSELPRGLSRVTWDGLDQAGRMTGPGTYFVTVRSPLGEARTQLTRVR